jgi:hypothetical protein
MDESAKPTRRSTAIRLLTAALAGAIGAFGVPAAVHGGPQAVTSAPSPSVAVSPDATPD